MINKLHVVGIGLDGLDGLSSEVRLLVQNSPAIAGPASHVGRIPSNLHSQTILLTGSVQTWPDILSQQLKQSDVTLLATGDPFFYGIGRLLAHHFRPEQLQFYPHLSCVQLACNRLHIPQQSITTISIHGRSLDALTTALKQSKSPIAILTDPTHSPAAIAATIEQLQLPIRYQLSVCSQLGGSQERIQTFSNSEFADIQATSFPTPNVVILEQSSSTELDLNHLPVFGLADNLFLTFPDRPGLITKQEVRSLSLLLLQLPTVGIIWDVGAGTGSVAVEISRLAPKLEIYAIEKDAAGLELIAANALRFKTPKVRAIAGVAPDNLAALPSPDRVFIGGGGQQLPDILKTCTHRLNSGGLIVGNFATLESANFAQTYLKSIGFSVQMLQVNLARSTSIAQSTRFAPLNPVTLVQAIAPIHGAC